jgi:hypothetical protein
MDHLCTLIINHLTYSKNKIHEFQKKILTICHIAGNLMTSIETENTSNKIPRQ